MWTLESVRAEIRYTIRGLRRAPAFTVIAIAILALAIGANTAIFSVVQQLLIRPLPYRDAAGIVAIDATRQLEGAPRPGRVSWSLDTANRWLTAGQAFSDLTFYANSVFELSSRDGAELLEGATVAPSFFSMLDGPIVAGRPLLSADAFAPSVVISERLARRLFGEVADAVGRRLVLNSAEYVIVGVAGPQWDIPSSKTDVWEPSGFAHARNAQCCAVQLLARLRPGVRLGDARTDVADTASRLATSDPEAFGRLHTTVTSLRDAQLGDSKSMLLVLWAAVAIVLATACANVANLLIARNAGHVREVSIRRALGASRARLVLHGIVESVLLAAAAIGVGLGIARVADASLVRVASPVFPRLPHVGFDPAVLAFAICLGVLTVMATGVLPAFHAADAPPPRTVPNAPTRRQRHLQRVLCVVQLAAAAVLLTSATLFGRSLADLLETDLGVAPEHVVTASIDTAFGRPHSADEIQRTMLTVAERVRQIPGVRAVGVGTSLPPITSRLMMSLKRKGSDVDYVASAVSCTPGYFEALGMRLLEGRFFTDSDDPRHPPVIVVGATTARHLFGDTNPIGQTLAIPKFRYRLTIGDQATVVGVVSDVKYSGIDTQAGDQVYWSLAQAPWVSTFLAIRTAGDIHIASDLRRVVASVDSTVAVSSIEPLDGIIATATAPARFRSALISAFALTGLAIAMIGLYGVIAYSVSRRTLEIGVRVALGARRGDVIALVLREGAAIAAVGIAIGLPAAYAASRTFSALLFGITPADVLTYAASASGLVALSLAATYLPARRAARIEPMAALRAE